jgi:hypothetical protein
MTSLIKKITEAVPASSVSTQPTAQVTDTVTVVKSTSPGSYATSVGGVADTVVGTLNGMTAKSIVATNVKSTQVANSSTAFKNAVPPQQKSQAKSQPQQAVAESPKNTYKVKLGISHYVPEIISITNFLPIVGVHGETPAYDRMKLSAEYAGMQEKLTNNVCVAAANNEAVELLYNTVKKDNLSQCIISRRHVNYLRNYVDKSESTMLLFDPAVAKINVKDTLTTVFSYMKSAGVNSADADIEYSALVKLLGETITYADALKELGYKQQNIQKFSGTKQFMQLTYELRDLLAGHSQEYAGSNTTTRQNDTEQYKLLVTPNSDIAKFIRMSDMILSDRELSATNSETVEQVISTITAESQKIKKYVGSLDRVQYCALMLYSVAKEVRYSTALQNESFVSELQKYGYAPIDAGNRKMFDTVFGQFPSNVFDNQQNATTQIYTAMTSLRMQNYTEGRANANVALFERNDTVGANIDFVPGADYYFAGFDGTSEPNPERLNALFKLLTSTFGGMLSFLSYIDAYAITADPKDQATSAKEHDTLFLSLLDHLAVVDFTAGTIGETRIKKPVKSTKTGFVESSMPTNVIAHALAMIEIASRNDNVLAALFTYFSLLRLKYKSAASKNNSQSPVMAAIERASVQLVFAIRKAVGTNNVISSQTVEITDESLFKILEHDSTENNVVMKALYDWINYAYSNDSVENIFIDGRTRYTGLKQTTLSYMIFSAMISLYGAISNVTYTNFIPQNDWFSKFTIKVDQGDKSSEIGTACLKRMRSEEIKTSKCITALLGHLLTLKNSISEVLSIINDNDYKTSVASLRSYVGAALPFLYNAEQLRLANNALKQFDSEFTEKRNQHYFMLGDEVEITKLDEAFSLVEKKLSTSKFKSPDGDNIRLLSIGITHGMSAMLRRLLRTESTKQQTDIISISVYKNDLEYQEIVFKPKKFLFELSRNERFKGAGKSLEIDVYDENGDDIRTSTSYSFLSQKDKNEILDNHSMSFILELYIRLMTGLQVNENSLYIMDPIETFNNVAQTTWNQLAQAVKIQNVGIASAGAVSQNKASQQIAQTTTTENVKSTFDGATNKQKEKLLSLAEACSYINKTYNSLSTSETLISAAVMPKAFDRVFHIAVDPDDYEIDIDETLKTEEGKAIYKALLKSGKIVEEKKQTSGGSGSYKNSEQFNQLSSDRTYKLVERRGKNSEAALEEYFVVVETYGAKK